MKNLLLVALLSCASVSANEVTAEAPVAPVENRTDVPVAPVAEEETTAPAPVEAPAA